MHTFLLKIARIGAKAPILLLSLIVCLGMMGKADPVQAMLIKNEHGISFRGSVRFDMLPEEVEGAERENGFLSFQVPRAFTLSWNRLEFTKDGMTLVYRFEPLDGLRLQEILWIEEAGEDADAQYAGCLAALCQVIGSQPVQIKLPCPTKSLRAFDERLFMKQGAYVAALSQWLIHVDEGDAAVDLYLCRSVDRQMQLRLGIMLLSDPEAAKNRAALPDP
ncbi:MAG: hypothetical protein IJ174_06295 [Clostridia bacterium]|nr:hypothetical protein [Clostridia bacterium]